MPGTTQNREHDDVFSIVRGDGPLVATAIHAGHHVREDVASLLALDDASRLREEDPFTDLWVDVAPTQVVVHRSRFEVDMNRTRDRAVYRKPEDAWGLEVWTSEPASEAIQQSLTQYDSFYRAMEGILGDLARRHGYFVVLDIHSYNHRRNGPDGPPAEPKENPDVNIGTGTLDIRRWGKLVERFIHALRDCDCLGKKLDVRENVKFTGGAFPRWIHSTFPKVGCAIAIEFKKIFMDEWTGSAYEGRLDCLHHALESAAGAIADERPVSTS